MHVKIVLSAFGSMISLSNDNFASNYSVMNNILILAILTIVPFVSNGQKRMQKTNDLPLTVFASLDDFKFDKGQKVGDFIGYDWTLGRLVLLTYLDKKNSRKHQTRDLWGFSIKDQVYRIVEARAYRVLDKGNGVYYENGFAHMNMLMDDEGFSDVDLGSYSFLSKTRNSEIFEIPSRKAEKAFENDASLQPFLECIHKLKPHKTEKIRECMKAKN